MLDAIPKESLIAVGTNGFTWKITNRKIFEEQLEIAVDTLHPKGVVVYGQTYKSVFYKINKLGIPVYAYPSHTMLRNEELKLKKEGIRHEG